MKTIAFHGRDEVKISAVVDLLIKVPSKSTPCVQEIYFPICHYLYHQVEQRLSILI